MLILCLTSADLTLCLRPGPGAAAASPGLSQEEVSRPAQVTETTTAKQHLWQGFFGVRTQSLVYTVTSEGQHSLRGVQLKT